MPEFTDAEKKVLPLLTLPEIIAAHRLDRSVSSIKIHKTNIIQKINAGNLCSAIAKLATLGVEFELLPSTSSTQLSK
jgi:DNA-binding NarL/FixJ family response regulator